MSSRIVLIHNNEPERMDYIKPLLIKLSDGLELKFEDIHEQSFKKANLISLVTNKLLLVIVNFKLRKYWKMNDYKMLIRLIDLSRFILNICINKKYRDLEIKKLKSDDVLTMKHLKVINDFALTSGNDDTLFVFESDAFVQDPQYLKLVIQQIFLDSKNIDLFQLAFPFTLNELNLNETKVYCNNEINVVSYVYPKFIMNTTGCYAISARLAKQMKTRFVDKKLGLYFAVDFYLNHILSKVSLQNTLHNKSGTKIFEPSPVLNGSINGIYKSTITFKDIS